MTRPLAHGRRRIPATLALMLAGLAAGGCDTGGPSSAELELPAAGLPVDPGERALHCYLVLTLTIDQLAEFEGTGPQAGFLARRSSQELLQARSRVAASLDPGLLEDLQISPRSWLLEVLDRFDLDGDGQLSAREEVEEFNRHVAACSRLRSDP
jgi:hypothetical protein